jgi:5'-phosphate synthase pdxT subunit
VRIGVLALQGGFIEHIHMLEKLGIEAVPIYNPGELEAIDGLVIPGGESTTILKLLHDFGLYQPLKDRAENGLPIMGTCAGMVLLASKVTNPDMITLGLMDIAVRRNAFGRQVDSFQAEIDIPALGDNSFPAIFIRAPFIESSDKDVEILGKLADGTTVAVRQENLLAVAFHPELGGDPRLHRYFLDMVASGSSKSAAKAAIPAD